MASTELRIAPDLGLPLDAVTETVLIFGKKGSGKTATAGDRPYFQFTMDFDEANQDSRDHGGDYRTGKGWVSR